MIDFKAKYVPVSPEGIIEEVTGSHASLGVLSTQISLLPERMTWTLIVPIRSKLK